jgi:diketogulonate reductase-like aldo/keto reductase
VKTAALPLRSGGSIPQVGLGVWQTPRGDTTREAVRAALRLGYRHIDTARIYGNETDVGAAVKDSGVPRAEVFVTTKLWNDDQGFDEARRAFDASLSRLGLDYVDLYLIHWPVAGKRSESWRALDEGLATGWDPRRQK